MEVVSPDPKDRERDYKEKLANYAAGGIGEYWIVDPDRQTVTIYSLEHGQYVPHGEFARGDRATSAQLKGFAVDVSALFAEADDLQDL